MLLQMFGLLSAFAWGLVIGMWLQASRESAPSEWETKYSKTRWKK